MSELFGSTKITLGLHCLNIRHKAMYVGELPNPGVESFYDQYDGTAYWCAETQTGFGPDGEPVRTPASPRAGAASSDLQSDLQSHEDAKQAFRSAYFVTS